MSSQFRPLLAGMAAITTCILLASMNWLLVLFAFVIASLSFAVWSLRNQAIIGEKAEKEEKEDLAQRRRRRTREGSSARRRRALRNGNVYQYPFRNFSEETDVSEVAD
jgi:hypothetical protein